MGIVYDSVNRESREVAEGGAGGPAGAKVRPMFEDFKRKRVTVGDIDIACVIGGEGPPVLLLHGYPQNLAMWGRVAPKRAARGATPA
jgi:pimeloyl-ACP methyl ester carboxylesterase